MKFFALAAAMASASAVSAHSLVEYVWINGVDQGNGANSYIRSPPNNNPVKDLTGTAISCNVNNRAVPKTLEVKAGDVITFEWRHDNRGDDIMDKSHVGPAQVWVAPTSSNGAGAVWAKLFSQGYTDDWATNKVINAKGMISVTVPDLKAGEYLFRPEFITLHEADTRFDQNSARGMQAYMECIQFKVTSSGSKTITNGVDFNKAYTYTDKGILFNIYGSDPKTYVAPGGAVSDISAGGFIGKPAAGSTPATSAAVKPVTTTSAKPTTTAQSTPTKITTVTVKPTTTTAAASAPTGAAGATAAKYAQCGGRGWTGATACAAGSTCKFSNEYYSQCL